MLPFLQGDFGNASSIHEPGRKAAAAVDLARARVAELIGADDPAQIVFTSGATEANNWVLKSFPEAGISAFEHSSLYEPALSLGHPIVSLDDAQMYDGFELFSLMTVNNETGQIFEPQAMRAIASLIHTDATQALGKIP